MNSNTIWTKVNQVLVKSLPHGFEVTSLAKNPRLNYDWEAENAQHFHMMGSVCVNEGYYTFLVTAAHEEGGHALFSQMASSSGHLDHLDSVHRMPALHGAP